MLWRKRFSLLLLDSQLERIPLVLGVLKNEGRCYVSKDDDRFWRRRFQTLSPSQKKPWGTRIADGFVGSESRGSLLLWQVQGDELATLRVSKSSWTPTRLTSKAGSYHADGNGGGMALQWQQGDINEDEIRWGGSQKIVELEGKEVTFHRWFDGLKFTSDLRNTD